MMIAPISGFGGFSSYRISSIHGNPNSMQPIGKIGEQNDQKSKPLVIAQKEQEDNLYIKDYGALKPTTQMETGAFATVLQMQESQLTNGISDNQAQSDKSFFNDTIGMMGYQNKMRDQLTGLGFEPF